MRAPLHCVPASQNRACWEQLRAGLRRKEGLFPLFKRGIVGSWHMEFRFNRRKRSDLFVDTMRDRVTADPVTFEQLTADAEPERVSA